MANKKMSQREHARRLARALESTTRRYQYRLIGRRAWMSHMGHLWAIVEDRGLRTQVARLLGL
jgi:hypothetical protein